ncbi:cytochrome c family protein [Bosea sp. 117]|uniref:c-type cytochrome n=1 Tax=Bosea sp. 117 TaxID=1125973 RepID=UPI000493C6C8|nr:cytochrome c family protein [Bosea sp. 117]
MNRILAAAALLALGSTVALADGDPEKGATVFKKCMACHAVGADAKNKVGPELNGIVGRKMGAVEGFNYSETLKQHNANGDVWDAEKLSKYLENPKAYLPGIKMVFAGLPKEGDRADLLAYLSQFDEKGNKK